MVSLLRLFKLQRRYRKNVFEFGEIYFFVEVSWQWISDIFLIWDFWDFQLRSKTDTDMIFSSVTLIHIYSSGLLFDANLYSLFFVHTNWRTMMTSSLMYHFHFNFWVQVYRGLTITLKYQRTYSIRQEFVFALHLLLMSVGSSHNRWKSY